MSNIQTLIEAGPDAFSNLYDVEITFPSLVKTSDATFTNTVSVRVQDFPFPQMTLQPYTIAYKAVTLKRFAPKITGARKLSIPIRINADWDIYKQFKAWKKFYMNDDTTNISFNNFINSASDLTKYGTIIVKAYNANSNLDSIVADTATGAKVWEFKNVACINVQEPQFTREAANPIVLNVDFLFGIYVPAGETDPLV